MSLISLVYVSSAAPLFSPDQLLSLLQTSRANNQRQGISGLLLYKDGNFMQAIEGEQALIQRLHDKIQHDPRHHGLITLLEKPITQRQFPQWSMGFRNLADPDWRATPGYSEFLNLSLDGAAVAANPSRALKLLENFRQKM